jgi:hypothetical protein
MDMPFSDATTFAGDQWMSALQIMGVLQRYHDAMIKVRQTWGLVPSDRQKRLETPEGIHSW